MPQYAITTGQVITIPQNEVYAMPSGLHFILTSAAIEASIDGTTFAALTGANTTGVVICAPFIRCTGAGGAKVACERY